MSVAEPFYRQWTNTLAEFIAEDRSSLVMFRRGRSARATTAVLREWFRAIGQVLCPMFVSNAFVLYMDTTPAHWTSPVARSAFQAGVHVCVCSIPARMTSALQHLDVHVFQHSKHEARDGFEALQIAHLGEQVPVMDVLRRWDSAFRFCGIAAHQCLVGRFCFRILRLQEAPWIADAISFAHAHI